MKNWSLRRAMLAVILIGIVALGGPAKAKAYHLLCRLLRKKTSPGSCGGAEPVGATEMMDQRHMTRSTARSYDPGIAQNVCRS